MGWVKGLFYCGFWYASILSGYLVLYCPLLPVLFISNKLYRILTDILFTFWQLYPTALLELCCSSRVLVTGDEVLPHETSLLVMNHRTRTDWNFLWPGSYHATPSTIYHPLKFVLKDVIRHIPGPGWVMQLSCFVYVKRSWVTDQKKLLDLVNYFSRLNYTYSLLIFPEGTDLTECTKRSSNQFAERNCLEKYEYVLHPRTTGFSFLANQLLTRKVLHAIYDVTLAYPDVIPQTEREIISGNFPKTVRFHVKRYRSEELPQTEDGLREFLEDLWKGKERILKEFYSTGKFYSGPVLERRRPSDLHLALVFWSVLPLLAIYLLLFHRWFRIVTVLHTIILMMINYISGGFQDFEIGLYEFKRKFLLFPW